MNINFRYKNILHISDILDDYIYDEYIHDKYEEFINSEINYQDNYSIFDNSIKTINDEYILFFIKSPNKKIYFIKLGDSECKYIMNINNIYNKKYLNKKNDKNNDIFITTIENNLKKNVNCLYYVKINNNNKNNYCNLLLNQNNDDILIDIFKYNKKYFICYCNEIYDEKINYKKEFDYLHYDLLKKFTSCKNNNIESQIESEIKKILDNRGKNCKKEMIETIGLEKNECELWDSFNKLKKKEIKYDTYNEPMLSGKFTPKEYEFIKFDTVNETSNKINKYAFGLTKINIIPWENKNIILSGGLLYDVLTNRFDNNLCDIDLFLTGNDFGLKITTCKTILDNLVENQYSFIVSYETNIITIIIKDIPRIIQLIFIKETVEQIVSSFDFTHLMFYYDGINVFGTKKSISQLLDGKKTEINDNYHNYRVIKYYRRGVNFDFWNDERNFFELNLTNRNKLLNDYLDKNKLKDSSKFIINKYNEKIEFKNYYDLLFFSDKINKSKEHFTSLVKKDISTFSQYIIDFKINKCENILRHISDSIYSLSARTIFIKCKLFKKILDIGGFLMMNYFIIQEKSLINYIINKIDIIFKKYGDFFGKEIFLPYESYDKNKMIICSSFRYKPSEIKDHLIMSDDIVVKLNNLNLDDEIECLFDFDFINIENEYTYINFSPIYIF